MDNRRMCPNCRAFITTSDRVCPYCGNQVGPRAIDRREPGALVGGLIPARHFTTFLILLVNLALFAATCWLSDSMNAINGRALWVLGAKLGPSIWIDHQYWRLVTAGFLHGSILHIAFNSYALFVLGSQVEEVFATPRFLVIYFVSTVGGFFLSARIHPGGLSIGASAGIMGLIGAMVAFGHASQSSVGRQIRNQYLGWLALNLVWGYLPGSDIDNYAHIGGFAGGFAVAWFAGTPRLAAPARETIWRFAGGACVLATAWCFWLMYRNFPSPEQLRQLFQP
jgi:membrane associated rhomboid family serine protease